MSNRPGRMGKSFLTEEEKKNRPKVTIKLLKRISSYLYPYWKQVLLIFICILVSSTLSLLPSILTGKIIDDGLINRNLDELIKLILLSLFVMLSSNLIGVLESYLNTWISQHIIFDMKNNMFKHLQYMPYDFYTTSTQGDIITRMTSDIDGIQSTISTTMTSILSNVITLIVALIAMFNKNYILAILGLIIVPLLILPTRSVGKTRWNITKDAQENQDKVNSILNETLSVSGQLLVKLFNKEEYEYNRFLDANKKVISLNIKERMAGRWFRVALNTFSSIGPMIIYLVGGILIMKYDSNLTVGDITVMVALLGKMYMPINSLMNIQVDWIRSMALFTRIFDYFDMPITIKNKENPIRKENLNGNIEFKDVYFSYDKERMILKNINLLIEKGKSIAIVGPSGSGKTTITNLIARLYDVDEGSIKIDNTDIRDLDLFLLRKNIGIVSQDSYMFNGTIKENLLYAKDDASESELIDACKKANIYDFISNLPEKFDSFVGNRGLKLSGGEKQRLSIARALLKNPNILILDEATSSLDSISESLIQDAIENLIKSRTSIIIAHRLSTIMSVDEIVVLKEGSIVEQGTHSELLKNENIYYELYTTQFLKHEE